MNRRTFLRSIATACGAAVVCPGELLKSPVMPVAGVGITNAQLCELIRATLKNLPQGLFQTAFTKMTYRSTPIYYQPYLSA